MRKSMRVIGPILSALAIVMLAVMALMDGGAVTHSNAMRLSAPCADAAVACVPNAPFQQGGTR